jgi:uncharacterized protein (DUF58 family)
MPRQRADASGRGRGSSDVTRAATPKLAGYALLAAFGLAAGIAFGRAELVVLAAPFAVVLTLGLALARTPAIHVEFRLEQVRALEGETVPAELVVRSAAAVERLELALALPPDVEPAGDTSFALSLEAGAERVLDVPLAVPRWGAYALGRMGTAAFDRFGLFVFEREIHAQARLRVYPREERLREIVRPHHTQPYVGNLVARTKAEGIEFADLRPYVRGDRVRRVNWRATARRGELVVNEQHPERNSATVLLLDSFADARIGGAGTLDQAVRATAAFAAAYARRRDQVGLLSFGGAVNWLEPAMGPRQLYRITEALLDTEVVLSYVWRDIRFIPVRALPPQALVLALTPLLDDRTADALVDVRGRGADVAVVEISPEPFIKPGKSEADRLAYRIWLLRRAAIRSRFRRLGVPLSVWKPGDPLEPVLEEVTAFRRYARATRV